MLRPPWVRAALLCSLLAAACACGGPEGSGAQEPGEVSCSTAQDCQALADESCPGGSVGFAQCVDGRCRVEGCSSPIGTPCDDDPSTVFEGEDCD